jgi:ethanolamine utilization protein EutA
VSDEAPAGGRVFFSNVRRSLEFEDEIVLVSVGVDIGSSTSHLVFSRLRLERLDSRYVVAERTVLHESEVLLTPYASDFTIDAVALREFVDAQYALAGVKPDLIDSGALILTGVAVRRSNARAIGDLFAAQAGKFVAVSAGDALETTLAAMGSGAAARSIREACCVLNIDIGGGTSKIARCEGGTVVAQTAVDIGARIVALDAQGRVQRVEAAGARLSGPHGPAPAGSRARRHAECGYSRPAALGTAARRCRACCGYLLGRRGRIHLRPRATPLW